MSEIKFSDGMPERNAIAESIPDEYKTKTRAECVRFEKRTHRKSGYHCCMKDFDIDVFPTDNACEEFWSKERQAELEKLHEQDIENRRKELWAVYAEKEPVKLPIVFDGYGNIPMCPICGEMPYSTEQCHWCGQRFIQDKQIEEYEKPLTEHGKCFNCGAEITINISKYNGHKSYRCENCGCAVME